MFKATEGRWGSREVEITDVQLLGEDGQPAHVFYSGERVQVKMSVHAAQAVNDFVFGVGLFNADGICCYGTNTNVASCNGFRSSTRSNRPMLYGAMLASN